MLEKILKRPFHLIPFNLHGLLPVDVFAKDPAHPPLLLPLPNLISQPIPKK